MDSKHVKYIRIFVAKQLKINYPGRAGGVT
jgi:hypothetical protein